MYYCNLSAIGTISEAIGRIVTNFVGEIKAIKLAMGLKIGSGERKFVLPVDFEAAILNLKYESFKSVQAEKISIVLLIH